MTVLVVEQEVHNLVGTVFGRFGDDTALVGHRACVAVQLEGRALFGGVGVPASLLRVDALTENGVAGHCTALFEEESEAGAHREFADGIVGGLCRAPDGEHHEVARTGNVEGVVVNRIGEAVSEYVVEPSGEVTGSLGNDLYESLVVHVAEFLVLFQTAHRVCVVHHRFQRPFVEVVDLFEFRAYDVECVGPFPFEIGGNLVVVTVLFYGHGTFADDVSFRDARTLVGVVLVGTLIAVLGVYSACYQRECIRVVGGGTNRIGTFGQDYVVVVLLERDIALQLQCFYIFAVGEVAFVTHAEKEHAGRRLMVVVFAVVSTDNAGNGPGIGNLDTRRNLRLALEFQGTVERAFDGRFSRRELDVQFVAAALTGDLHGAAADGIGFAPFPEDGTLFCRCGVGRHERADGAVVEGAGLIGTGREPRIVGVRCYRTEAVDAHLVPVGVREREGIESGTFGILLAVIDGVAYGREGVTVGGRPGRCCGVGTLRAGNHQRSRNGGRCQQ